VNYTSLIVTITILVIKTRHKMKNLPESPKQGEDIKEL